MGPPVRWVPVVRFGSGKLVPSIRLIFFIFQLVFNLAEKSTHDTSIKSNQITLPIHMTMCNTVLHKINMCNELYKCDTILLYKKMMT